MIEAYKYGGILMASRKKHHPINLTDMPNLDSDLLSGSFPGGNIRETIDEELNFLTFAKTLSEHYIPDTYGCDYFFLLSFPTTEMENDYPEIVRYLLTHDYEKYYTPDIKEYLREAEQSDYSWALKMNWVFNMMMTQAEQGNAHAINFFKYLYETYYRKEYRQLRRFKKMSGSELVSFTNSSDMPASKYLCIARLITMCRFYGIVLEGTANSFFLFFDNLYSDFSKNFDADSFNGFSNDIYESAQDFEKEYLDPLESISYRERKKRLKAFLEAEEFAQAAIRWIGLPQHILDQLDWEFDSDEERMVRTRQLMQHYRTQKNYDFDDVQRNSVILKIICAFENYVTNSEEQIMRLLGYDPERFDYENERRMFDPQKLDALNAIETRAVPAKANSSAPSIQKILPPESSVSEEDYLSVIEKLRQELRKKEKEKSFLEQKITKLEDTLKEEQARVKAYDAEHSELLRIRSYLAQIAEQEPDSGQVSLDEMEEYLRQKKIVIIGGHDNWTYKLKNRFRKWVFLKAEVNVANDGHVLNDADGIYFFTDILSHGTYGKFIRIIREKQLPYGYIHSININANITQIYLDIKESEEE